METFPATYFTFSTRYPENGVRMQLGRSYMHTAASPAPDQRKFILNLSGMQYFCDGVGGVLLEPSPERNMAVLEKFYNDHKTAYSFLFTHPVYGELVCKFATPLDIPEGIVGGDGLLPDFKVELLERP